MKKLLLTFGSLFAVAKTLFAAELGDAAKPLDIMEWIKGGPVDLASGKGKTIYVVEFWATWCPPCLTSIPHLTEMQKQFKDKDVVFIGISSEKPEIVKKFVKKMGDKMDYAVAVDAGGTTEGYMVAYDVQSIPHAFVVNKDGNVIWQGYPMEGLAKALGEIIEGKYDLAAAKKRILAQAKLNEYVQLTITGESPEKAAQLETELIALEKEYGNIMEGEKFDPAELKRRIAFGQKVMKYRQVLAAGDDDAEVASLEKELEAEAPKDINFKELKENIKRAMAQRKELMEIQQLFNRYAQTVGDNGNAEKATELGSELASLKTTNAEILRDIAWTILTDENIKQRDTKLALDLARRAAEASGSTNAIILDTYARALFETGDKAGAIIEQKKALERVEDEDEKAEMQASLARYEAASKSK